MYVIVPCLATHIPNPVARTLNFLHFYVHILAAHIYAIFEELLGSDRFGDLLKNTIEIFFAKTLN